ncbi:MAG: serine/threonine-protein kinase [Polyangiales bacterium]
MKNLRVAGTQVDGRYTLERMLARGGMSDVWIARHRLLDRRVAMKFMRVASDEARDALLDEAKILASLRHPGIVEVFDCGLHESDTPYLVMELIEAESLRERLTREGPMPARAAVKLVLPVVRGAHAAHERSVIHRDIKPENILCTSGAAPSVKLIDFGIARVATTAAAPFSASGTPAYMAPEQVRGEPCDRRSDVWALAVTLYELLSGAPPFDGVDITETLSSVLVGHVGYPRRARELDGALWKILMTALRVDPSQRFETAERFAIALEQWLEGRDGARAESRPTPRAPVSVARADTESVPSLDALIREKLSGS